MRNSILNVPYEVLSDREKRAYRRELRRRRERRRKILHTALAVAAALCLVLIGSLAYGSIRSEANSGLKYFDTVTVTYGDTLWELSDQYIDYDHYKDKNAYIHEVCRINHIYCDELVPGEVLFFPYYSSELAFQ